jgi:nucleoside 2-deoxyribosyltransferase
MNTFAALTRGLVYILGPMTGYPKENVPMFQKAATRLRKMKFTVCCPPELDLLFPVVGKGEARWRACMRRDLRLMVDCDLAVALPGWRQSRGATLETCVLGQLSVPVWEYRGKQGTFDEDLLALVTPDKLPYPRIE